MATLLLDGDIAAYRVAAVNENEHQDDAVSNFIDYCLSKLEEAECDTLRVFFTPSDKSVFRYKLFPQYKANRPPGKPKHLNLLRSIGTEYFKAEIGVQCEADDLLGIHQSRDTVIGSIDKDLLMIPGRHLNLSSGELSTITPQEGRFNFWCQMLIGDSVDNIKGVAGIGKKKAPRHLDGLSEDEMFETVRMLYDDDYRFILNANLLGIWRKPFCLYTPEFQVQTYATEEDFNKALEELVIALEELDKELDADKDFE